MNRREILKTFGMVSIAFPGLAACASVTNFLEGNDPVSEVTALFLSGAITLQAIDALVQTGVVSKGSVKTWQNQVNAVATQFATLHSSVDSELSIGQTAIVQAEVLLQTLESLAAQPASQLTTAKVAEFKAQARPKVVLTVAAILSFIINNLGTLSAAGTGIASLVQDLINQFAKPASASTAADADNAYNLFTTQLAAFNSMVA